MKQPPGGPAWVVLHFDSEPLSHEAQRHMQERFPGRTRFITTNFESLVARMRERGASEESAVDLSIRYLGYRLSQAQTGGVIILNGEPRGRLLASRLPAFMGPNKPSSVLRAADLQPYTFD